MTQENSNKSASYSLKEIKPGFEPKSQESGDGMCILRNSHLGIQQ